MGNLTDAIKTARDLVRAALAKGGIESAQKVELTLQNGETILVVSDRHPALDLPATEVTRVTPKQTAEGGN